jgi:hypothetical protein
MAHAVQEPPATFVESVTDVLHGVEIPNPYHAVLLISGDADALQFNAYAQNGHPVQAATSSHCPVLLDHKSAWGHVPIQTLNRRIDSPTDRLVFVRHELNVGV